jgi:O-antigen/teichoic acid export membrane protein
MIAREQTALRNVSLLLIMRGLLVAGGVVVAAVVPRLMGPSGYGQMALLVALSFLFSLAANLGFTQVLGRHAPTFVQRGDEAGLTSLFGRLLAIRVGTGFVTGGLYLGVTSIWLHDLDLGAKALLAAAVWVRAPAGLFYALHLGLNRAARWGVADLLRQAATLGLMLPGYLLGGLRGAALGVLVGEMVILLVGLVGVRAYAKGLSLRFDWAGMAPFLRFGLVFYASDLILVAFERSGEALVRLGGGNYAEVGYFGVAHSAFLTGAVGMPQIAIAFAPLLTMVRLEGDQATVRLWIERLLKGLALGSVVVVLAAVLLARDVVPLVFGSVYLPVAANLVPMALCLLPLSLTSVANLSALTHDRPGVALGAAGVRLCTFWCVGLPLVRHWGSWGACLAMLGAVTTQALYFTWRMRRAVGYSLAPWLRVVGLGMLFLPLALLRSSRAIDVALFAGFLVAYAGLVFALGLVKVKDLTALGRAITSVRTRPAAEGGEV